MSSVMREFEHLRIPLEIIRGATNNFSEENFIAEGGYGKVYRGEFLGSEGRTMAAVKRWSLLNEEGDPEFQREIMLLSDNKHENLILLLGFCFENKERILVYEYAPNKSLDNHLRDPNFSWIQRLKVCLGAARGLEYLHNPKGSQRVLHFDIKSANILLDENWNAKIADFGLSKYGPANQNRSYLITQAKGTPGYADPAFIASMIYTKESDVYSFGVVLFEVLCSRPCFDFTYVDERRSLLVLAKKFTKEQIRDTLVDVNLRQQMEEDSFDAFVTVAQQCLVKEQKARPSMDLIVEKIENALKYQERRNVLSNQNYASSSTPYAGKQKHDLLAQKEQAWRNAVTHKLEKDPDDDIERWASGKEGNLPALLSTLHDILGPESGWEPVSLTVDVYYPISTHAVRKTYDKAVFLIRPVALKERGASRAEKYICRKVREILKVGLIKFNSDEAVIRWSSKCKDLGYLLSTLQDILEPGSGWEPVSLEGEWGFENLGEAYLKSVFLTDPSKLSKRGASMKEKFICGKVREILKIASYDMCTR